MTSENDTQKHLAPEPTRREAIQTGAAAFLAALFSPAKLLGGAAGTSEATAIMTNLYDVLQIHTLPLTIVGEQIGHEDLETIYMHEQKHFASRLLEMDPSQVPEAVQQVAKETIECADETLAALPQNGNLAAAMPRLLARRDELARRMRDASPGVSSHLDDVRHRLTKLIQTLRTPPKKEIANKKPQEVPNKPQQDNASPADDHLHSRALLSEDTQRYLENLDAVYADGRTGHESFLDRLEEEGQAILARKR